MSPLRRDILTVRFFEPLAAPAIVVGGLLMAVIGGYQSIRDQQRCHAIGARSGYEESYIVPGRRGAPDQCVCRGHRDEHGNVDMTASVSFPLD